MKQRLLRLFQSSGFYGALIAVIAGIIAWVAAGNCALLVVVLLIVGFCVAVAGKD